MAASGADFFTLNEVNRLKMIQDVGDRRLTGGVASHVTISCLQTLQKTRLRLSAGATQT